MAKAKSAAKQAAGTGVKPEHAAIVRAIAAIPRGRVASYGEIAARANLPRHARLVGRVLGDAGAEAKLPWHRVLRADGRSAFPAGSEQQREQLDRLRREGVEIDALGRVRARRQRGRSMDEAVWGPD